MQEEEKFDQKKYQVEFRKKNYDRVELTVPKGWRERIKGIAQHAGQSVSEYVAQAVEERIKRETE